MSDHVQMHYEPKFRAMWHDNCTNRFGGPMVPLVVQLYHPAGYTQRLWRCVTCRVEVFYGVDTRNFVRVDRKQPAIS